MQNLKIRVNNEAESKEAQELFFKLGFEKSKNCRWLIDCTIDYLATDGDELYCWDSEKDGESRFKSLGNKEITLPELRDLVVLKRNDKNDRNVIDPEYDDANLYLDSKSELFVFHLPTQTWKESNLNHEPEVLARLKPVGKSMKEYLMPSRNYEYILTDAREALEPHAKDWIEIPEGAQIFLKGSLFDFFRKKTDEVIYYTNQEGEWHKSYHDSINPTGLNVLWQRATHPGELPFIDDEPRSLNDQYAEIEKVRQDAKDNVNHPSHYTQGKVECIDALESATIGKSGIEAVCVANVIKYLWRYEDKGGLESILKAKWYLDKLIECKK